MTTSGTDTMRIGFHTVDGTPIRYGDSVGAHDQAMLLTSPWPESVYAFTPVWSMLAKHARLLAVDLPGFGGSEHSADLASPSAMGGFLARLVDEFDLGASHLVAPDVGTAAALFAAAAHPRRFPSVVVGSGGAATPIQLGEPLASWVLDPDLDRFRKLDPQAVIDAALGTIGADNDERLPVLIGLLPAGRPLHRDPQLSRPPHDASARSSSVEDPTLNVHCGWSWGACLIMRGDRSTPATSTPRSAR